MNLQNLSSKDLISSTHRAVKGERKSSVDVLWHLVEVETRDLHFERGFGSLHDFCTESLKYSEGAASRRVHAARLMKDCPDVGEDLVDGRHTLTTLSLLQTFFKNEKVSDSAKKRAWIKKTRNMSKKKCERALAEESTKPEPPREVERPLRGGKTELRLIVSHELLEKMKKLQALLSHQLEDSSYAALLEKMVDIGLEQFEPKRKSAATPPAEQSRYVSKELRNQVWKKDRGQCAFVDPESGRQCCSTYYLQIDHITPFAAGGPTTIDNLRLLCFSHNQYAAKVYFGPAPRVGPH